MLGETRASPHPESMAEADKVTPFSFKEGK